MEKNPVLDKIKELLENAGEISEEKAKEVLTAVGTKEIDKASNPGKKQPALPNSKATTNDKAETNEGKLPPWLAKKDKPEGDEKEDDDKEDDDESDDKSEKEDSKEDDKEDDKEEKAKVKKESFDVQAHMNALFANESSLTEDFKSKAATIFEAALNERVEALREEVAAEYEEFIAEELENNRTEIVEQLNQYLEYIAEQWVEDNKLAVDNGIRNEITESFITGLRDLFLNHGIEVPETEVDVVDELSDRIAELEEALNEELQKNVELSSAINEQEKKAAIIEIGETLNDTQFDKFVQLAENISYSDSEDLTSKLQTIKESYFSGKTTTVQSKKEDDLTPDDAGSAPTPEVISEQVNKYARAIDKFYN